MFGARSEHPGVWNKYLWLRNPPVVHAHFIKVRWKYGEFCPYCKHDLIYHLKGPGAYKCAKCKRAFSITVGTIFEGAKKLHEYVLAIALLCDRNGKIGSTELGKLIGVSQRSAWMMLEKLREASLTPSFNEPFPPAKQSSSRSPRVPRHSGAKGNPQFRWREAEARSRNQPDDSLSKALVRPHRVAAAQRLARSSQFSLIYSGDRREHEEVEAVLKKLHRARQLAGGPHESDASRAVKLFKPLSDRGYRIDPAACHTWAEAHDWEDFSALELAVVVEELCSKP